MTESKTPRTDDLARGNHVVPTEFAEQLETELNEAKFDLEFRRDLYKIKELEIDGLKRAVKELSDDLQELRSVARELSELTEHHHMREGWPCTCHYKEAVEKFNKLKK